MYNSHLYLLLKQFEKILCKIADLKKYSDFNMFFYLNYTISDVHNNTTNKSLCYCFNVTLRMVKVE